MSLMSLWGAPLAPHYMALIWSGLRCTLVLSIDAIALAMVLGLLLCVMRLAAQRWMRTLAVVWLSIFRNTPLLLQLLFWYYGVPGLLPNGLRQWLMTPSEWTLFGSVWDGPSWEFLSALIGLTLYTSAYLAEECRAGVAGVSAGQRRAAHALGMSSAQTWVYVVLPQALRLVVSPLMGQFMNAIKNSSLAMAVGYTELSYVSDSINTETLKTFQVLSIVTLLYIATIAVVELANAALSAWMIPLNGQRR